MEEFIPIIAVVAVLVLMAVVAGVGVVLERRRREALRQAARELGFAFKAECEILSQERMEEIELLQSDRNGERSNLIRGTAGNEVLIFDYRYVTGSGRSRATHEQTVAAFHLPGGSLPAFQLRPENMLHRIGSAFGYQDIDFDSHPDFSQRFLVRGADENAVRSLFSPWVLAFFEGLEKKQWCWVEGGGEWLIVYRHEELVEPSELRALLDEASALATAFGAARR